MIQIENYLVDYVLIISIIHATGRISKLNRLKTERREYNLVYTGKSRIENHILTKRS